MPAPALHLFYDLSEGSKLHFRFDLDMARYYKGKRIGANVYTQGKFGKGLREIVDTDNPLLYSDGRYPTKLTAADLPEDYIKISSRVIWYMKGYLRTSGIVDMMYRWVREYHLFKDDYIYISYQELICRGWFLPSNTYDCDYQIGTFVRNRPSL